MGSTTICNRLAAGFFLFAVLLCTAHARGSEASYVSFQVPGASGTHPMSVNSAMAVTGYYYASPTLVRGFVRAADGTFSTFDAVGSSWTEPEGINDAGEVTGYYLTTQQGVLVPESFIRYENGRIDTFNPPCFQFCDASVPFSINQFGKVAGTYPYYSNATQGGYTRGRDGSFTTLKLEFGPDVDGVVATSINASGTVTGFYQVNGSGVESFKEDARGYLNTGIYVPAPGSTGPYTDQESTLAVGINAEGTIVGWYQGCNRPCTQLATEFMVGAFLLSPQGNFSLFNPPGNLVISPQADYGGEVTFFENLAIIAAPHLLSINQSGSVIGSYTDAGGAQHGFVRNPYGTITSFDPPKGHQTTATSINDSGVITGTYLYNGTNPTAVGFLRIPQPTP